MQAHKGFDFDRIYMAKVDDFLPALPLLFPDCNVSSMNTKTNEVIQGDSRNVTCKYIWTWDVYSKSEMTQYNFYEWFQMLLSWAYIPTKYLHSLLSK